MSSIKTHYGGTVSDVIIDLGEKIDNIRVEFDSIAKELSEKTEKIAKNVKAATKSSEKTYSYLLDDGDSKEMHNELRQTEQGISEIITTINKMKDINSLYDWEYTYSRTQ